MNYEAIIRQEIDQMVERCAAAGVPRESVISKFRFIAFTDSLIEAIEIDEKKEAPFNALIRTAFNASKSGNKEALKAASEAWLLAKHGLRIGDVASVYGWTQPREILLEEFELSWRSHGTDDEEGLSDCFLYITGPTSTNVRSTSPDSHIVPHDCRLAKTTPSRKLQDKFSERLARFAHA